MTDGYYKLLSVAAFSKTIDWNIKQLFDRAPISSSYPFEPLGKSLCRNKERMTVEDDKYYSRITIKTNHGGIVLRDTVKGKYIRTKQQYFVHAGQLAVSKIDARNGAFGVVPPEADNAIITGNFWVYDTNENMANIKYLTLLFSTGVFTQVWQDCSNGSGNRLYLQERKFLQYKIPFPDLEEQNALVSRYENMVASAESYMSEAERLASGIDQYLFDILGIDMIRQSNAREGLISTSKFAKLSKWGAEFNVNVINPGDVFKSNRYENVPLTSLCEINPQTVYPDDIENVSFLPMKCVSDVYGEIIESVRGKAARAKGYTRFQENDILWAKITPCMQNGKCTIAKNLENDFGYGSTEFHVFRVCAEKALPEYLYCFLRTSLIREVAQTYFTGSAGQKRVGADFFEALTIPVIPITSEDANAVTQTQIAIHIEGIKAKIKTLRQKAEDLRALASKEFEGTVFGG